MILSKKIPLLIVFGVFTTICFSQSKQKDSVYTLVNKYIEEDKKEEALKLAITQLDAVTKKESTSLQIKWNRKIGELFSHNNNYPVSLTYYNNALALCNATQDSLAMAQVYFDIGSLNLSAYSKQSYLEQDTNVALDKRDAAFSNFNYLLDNFKNIDETDGIIAKTYANLTGIYSLTSDYTKAELTGKKAIEYYTKLKDTISIVGVKINLGVTQIYQEKYDDAEQSYLELLPLLKDTTNLKILNYKEVSYANLAHIYSEQNKHKAANKYLSLSHQLNVLYLEKTSNEILSEIEAKYNQNKARQEEIAKTKIEIEKKEKTQLILGISITTAISLLLFAAFLYRNSKLKAKKLELQLIQKEYNQQQQIQELREQNQNKIITATLDGKLKERKYIAQTLHDSVSALLSSANMHLQVVKKKSKHQIDELEKSQLIINEASDIIRDLSHKLISSVLIKFGLKTALQDLCEKYSNDDLLFTLHITTQIPRYEQDFEIKIFNIIQESTNNIIKHSNATTTSIYMKQSNRDLLITIEDNGVGFDTENTVIRKGIGLDLIKSRIRSLNGQVLIKSTKGKGTCIQIIVPVVMA
ncbi:MAG: tetratricopeptide repeat-containing sensor histidine kinase [Flavobacteriaceae bacterium]